MPFPYIVYFPFRSFDENELKKRASAVIPATNLRKLGQSEPRRLAYFAGRAALAVALERVGLRGAKVAAKRAVKRAVALARQQ